MTLLVLGGTGEAKRMAQRLHQRGVDLIYSVAGLVRQPDVSCPVVSGGFSQHGGLQVYIGEQKITALLDMTHPYALQMSQAALSAAEQLALPYWRYQRPAWQATSADHWHYAESYQTLWPQLVEQPAVLWTSGQLPSSLLQQLMARADQRHIIRTAVRPLQSLPDHMQWIEAIGPFSEEQERELMEREKITALVSKDSGGNRLASKLIVARQKQLPVFLLKRPRLPTLQAVIEDLETCEACVVKHMTSNKT